MHRRKSFLFRLFALLFALLLLITASVELALYHYARQVVGQEYIRLNQAGLRQISYTLGQGMTDTQTLAKRIAESTQLIELLSGPAGERADEAAHDLLYSLSSDYVWQRGIKMLMDSYVVGFNGVTAATYSSRQFNYDAVLADPRYEPLFSGTQDALLLPTTTHPEATGIFVHSFQYAQLIRDHLTQEPLGVVILNISEVSLYSQYLRHQSADNRFFLTDGSGTIVSARDKLLIGSIYAYTPEELDALAAETSLSRRIDGGQIRLYERIPGTDWYLVEEMSASAAFGTLNLVRNGAFLATGLCAALILAVLLYAYRQILRPITQLQASLGRVMEGRLDERIDVRRKDEFGRIQEAFNGMVEQISTLLESVKREEREKHLAELDFLQAQINPHFIYNTLSSIRFLLEMDKVQEAGEMVFYFSKLLRQTLSRSVEFIPLGEELDTLKCYVELQHLRYPDTFDYSCEVDEALRDNTLPKLLLQPVVENSIFHGVGRHKIHIRLRGWLEGDTLILRVEDDGVGISKDKIDQVMNKDLQINRVGLKNVQERIRLNYGPGYGLTVTGGPAGGTVVTFRLPRTR